MPRRLSKQQQIEHLHFYSQEADVAAVRALLEAGVDPASIDDQRRTALHHAALGTRGNRAKTKRSLAVMELLLEAKCPLEAKDSGGATPLFVAATFASSVAPLQLLLDKGARADVSDAHGNHILENANSPHIQRFLSRVIGKPVPIPSPDPIDALQSVPLSASQWRTAKRRIEVVFNALASEGLVALHNAGDMQADGFADCSEIYRDRGGRRAGLHGFCWYSAQDVATAKWSSRLCLCFWGAPRGAEKDMVRVGSIIVDTFRAHGYLVVWDGSGGRRPVVYLQPTQAREGKSHRRRPQSYAKGKTRI